MNSEVSRAEFSPVVIAPTYNNADTLVDVLRRVEAVGAEILVVNDGSTDRTAELLAEWVGEETINSSTPSASRSDVSARADPKESVLLAPNQDWRILPERPDTSSTLPRNPS